jgi:tRNA G18 (ribose-2'-O)-methylase SpoU
MIITVTEPSDERLQPFRWRDRQLASRTDRLETVGAGLFVAEGDLVVERALAAGCTPCALLCDETFSNAFAERLPDIDIYSGPEDLRREVTGLGVPLRAMGLFVRPPLVDAESLLSTTARVIVAESIDNPTNLGAIIRSAVALGWGGIVLSRGSTDPLARRALRVSMGTGLSLPFTRVDGHDSPIAQLHRHGFRTVALTPDDSAKNLHDVTVDNGERIAVLLGSERDGLRADTLTEARERVRIPMHNDIDSLNVGVAAAIALYSLGPKGH